MADEILLNKKIFHLNESGLPCLVHYKERMGGSHFTVAMVADMFLRGAKILFFTAYVMAKDDFLAQTAGREADIFFAESAEQLPGAEKYQAVILRSGDSDLFKEALKSLPDLSERVILVKNFERFDREVINASLGFKKIILSGNIDKCEIKERISGQSFSAIIAFSEPETPLPLELPSLRKYAGYLKAAGKDGSVEIKT
jgi:hypothetical protein